MNIYVLFTIVFVLEFIALYAVKKFSLNSNDLSFLLVSIICYGLIPIVLWRILKIFPYISIVNLVWNIFSTLYCLFIGLLIFKEMLTTKQVIGIVLGMSGLTLLLWQDNGTNF